MITTHDIQCPFCGSLTPAYPRYIQRNAAEPQSMISRADIESWGDNYSFFPEDQELRFNAEVWQGAEFSCPICGRVSAPHTAGLEVRIQTAGRRITLTLDYSAAGQIGELLVTAANEGRILRFPLKETVCFDLGKGRVYLCLNDADGFLLKTRDTTEANDHWRSSSARAVLEKYALARRKLAAAFRALWNQPLPYSNAELKPESFLLMTRFCAYPRSFFEGIPYNRNGQVDRSFLKACRKLRSSDKLPMLYGASSLPKAKSIRRVFFTSPELFLYFNEAEILWSLAGDVNYFRTILESAYLFGLLAYIHRFPGAVIFFRDYIDFKGIAGFLRLLDRSWYHVQNYAAKYAAMSESGRRAARKTWTERDAIIRHAAEPFSVPNPIKRSLNRNDIVGGYRFEMLRTNVDFVSAGQALDNCLVDWDASMNPVFVMKKGDMIEAAVEICRNNVIQARGPGNDSLMHDPILLPVLKKWARRNRLTLSLDDL